ncbi:glycoside hydrolase family 32 protein [Streptomyces sp. NPDC127190]|uniref:glycoside hydrolase family 32 protein n=1 Tax=unclassified Streptomyces TaxID=2593676 RepID=UPI003625C456
MNRLSPTRRALFATAAAGAGAALLPTAPAQAKPGRAPARGCASYRAGYHFTVPDQWKNDPQRPVWIDGEYHYYYLYNADYLDGETGTAWRLATSTDLVSFTDRGIAVPKDTTVNGDVWSGSAVVDTEGTAGFGAGAVIALVTMSPGGGTDHQEQFLYWSADGGRTFRNDGTAPVLASPGTGADFRDPKVVRDDDRGRWVMALAEGTGIGFYHSTDLRSWTRAGGFHKEGIGTLECPDLFRITTDDGSVTTWVLGASADGTGSGRPPTYAYWTGSFDGSTFTADSTDPQWLDHGWDWYAAVTFEKRRADGSVDPAARYALGWLNNWAYAHTTPTIDADGFNGTDSVVREIALRRAADGTCYLASRPVPALDAYAGRTVRLGDLTVDGLRPLDYTGISYELTTEISWSRLTGAGVQLRRSPDGGRHIDAGVWGDYAFLNRRGTVNPDTSGGRQESRSPFDPSGGRVRLRILVDRTSVEMFVDDGRYVHSAEVFPYLVDNRLALFAAGGTAVFRNTVIREFTL